MAIIDCPQCNNTLYKVMKNVFHCHVCLALFQLDLILIGELQAIKPSNEESK